MKLLNSILKFPIPRYTFNGAFYKSLFLCFIYDVCFVYFFKPNEVIELEFNYLFPIYYAITVLFCGLITMSITPYIFFNSINKWNVFNEILFFIVNLFISTFILSVSYFCIYFENFTYITPLKIFILITYIGLFPSILIILVKISIEVQYLNKSLVKLKKSYTDLKNSYYFNKKVRLDDFLIKGNNKNEELLLKEDELLYICSEDNYINIFYLDNDSVQKKVFRGTLNNIYDQLKINDIFLKCHRSYIVNSSKIESVIGNKRSAKLKIEKIKDFIPIGISYYENIKSHKNIKV